MRDKNLTKDEIKKNIAVFNFNSAFIYHAFALFLFTAQLLMCDEKEREGEKKKEKERPKSRRKCFVGTFDDERMCECESILFKPLIFHTARTLVSL
jgi:hypothetical protein